MEFEWGENKNFTNIQKHKIDFNDVIEIFNDENRKISPDFRNDYGEDRWITIGKVGDLIIVAVYTIRNQNFRIISARYAKKGERKLYKEK
ncbi:MAG: hypothetical protein A2046_10855 [Bacteroidetes bacterium GWA2_30_7]|nr:MAG: hypothetical protein A2046_10855 [Bacteroidetes bacterium GWA2_30_7]